MTIKETDKRPLSPDIFEATNILHELPQFQAGIHLISDFSQIASQLLTPSFDLSHTYFDRIPPNYSQLEIKMRGFSIFRTFSHTPVKHQPFILQETGASFCSLLLTFTAEGAAMLLHAALIDDNALFSQALKHKLNKYHSILTQLFPTNSLTILTATNLMHPKSQSSRNQVCKIVGEMLLPETNLTTLFVSDKYSLYLNLNNRSPDKQSNDDSQPCLRSISGLSFIPKQMTTTELNEILIHISE
jgi:hypothetical protein